MFHSSLGNFTPKSFSYCIHSFEDMPRSLPRKRGHMGRSDLKEQSTLHFGELLSTSLSQGKISNTITNIDKDTSLGTGPFQICENLPMHGAPSAKGLLTFMNPDSLELLLIVKVATDCQKNSYIYMHFYIFHFSWVLSSPGHTTWIWLIFFWVFLKTKIVSHLPWKRFWKLEGDEDDAFVSSFNLI